MKTINDNLDKLSEKLQEKPTLHLPGQCIKITATTTGMIDAFINSLYQILNAIAIPVKIVSDRKFCTHSYQSSFVFKSNNGTTQTQQQSTDVSICEQALIYISFNLHNIEEPKKDRITTNIKINGLDYDIPINWWYTLKINGMKMYFYINVDVTNDYKGIVFAIHKDNSNELDKLKDEIQKHYIMTLGRKPTTTPAPNVASNAAPKVQVIGDIL